MELDELKNRDVARLCTDSKVHFPAYILIHISRGKTCTLSILAHVIHDMVFGAKSTVSISTCSMGHEFR